MSANDFDPPTSSLASERKDRRDAWTACGCLVDAHPFGACSKTHVRGADPRDRWIGCGCYTTSHEFGRCPIGAPAVTDNRMADVQKHDGYNETGRGVKLDHGKDRFHFLPFDLLAGENRVWEIGAKKYTANNWRKGMPTTQPLNAALRHLFAFAQGQDLDPETGESHLDHAMCCIRMMQNTLRYHPSLDDRAKWTAPEKSDV